jgi:hypothetical protein
MKKLKPEKTEAVKAGHEKYVKLLNVGKKENEPPPKKKGRDRWFQHPDNMLSPTLHKLGRVTIDSKFFIPFFMKKMDPRLRPYQRTLALFEVICLELGGQANLTHTMLHSVAQLVFCIYQLEKLESSHMCEEIGDGEFNMSRWEKLTDKMQKWAKLVGIEKRVTHKLQLRDYLAQKQKEA